MSTIRPTSVPTKRLAASISASASSFTLTDIEGWDGVNLTSSSFGTKAYGVFRDATNSNIELFEWSPSTIASSSITIVLRGLKFDGDLTTEVSGNKRAWTKGTLVELGTHVPQLFRNYVDILEAQTIAGAKTFSTIPLTTGGSPTADNELARKAYVDAVAAGGSGIPNRVVVAGNAGATVSAGNLVYLDAADGKWKLCDADTVGTVDNIIMGIAQGAGTDTNPISNGILLYGLDSNQSSLTDNTVYYASNTAGGVSTTPGTTEVTVGVSRSTTTLLFCPRYNQVITENQQDFLDAAVTSVEWYAATSTGNDSYAITVTPAIAAYASGQRFRFKTDVANTGPCSLNVSGLGAKTIKKLHDQDTATGDIESGQIVEVVYDGTNFQMVSQPAQQISAVDYQAFTGNGTWTKPSNVQTNSTVLVEAWGAGGGGGALTGSSNGAGVGGGGGGAYVRREFLASSLGATETVTIGTAGSGATGSAGGNTTFGSWLTAYGGGGGGTYAGAGVNSSGAGGGGALSVGSNGTQNDDTQGGVGGEPGGGATASATAGDGSSGWGGGGGGAAGPAAGAGRAGGSAGYGGGGGGGGGDNAAGGTGGSSLYGGGGGGGGGTSSTAGTSKFGGAGGAGGNNAAGSAGSAPGGGGGGASRTTAGAAAGGDGARGEVRVTTYI